ncbi:MAG: helix-turn-helix domain-containing protein [Prevotella sp.]|nr:helix-turn-helix domain-containing protein [Prevotella sp.]
MATERNPELRSAWEFVEHTGTSIFLTGKAGTGKTTFLRTVVERSTKQMVVVAPTGVAAINAGGVTIHSFFQLPLSPYVPGADVKKIFEFGREKRKIISSMDLLIIDEISMVRSDLLDAIDSVLRRYRNHYKPFGGVQLLMIGDLAQLTPVVTPEDEEILRPYYDTPYFFGSKALQQISYVTIQLKKIYRQADTTFVDLLNHIRDGHPTAEDLVTLHKRYNPTFLPEAKDGYIRLTTHNRMADEYNDHEMQRLSSQPFTYSAVIDGTFPDYSYPTAFYLTLKVGAQVMFIKNDVNGEYYNGKIGHVVALDKENIKVRCIGESNDIDVGMQEWENAKYSINPETHEIETEVQGVFRQYPLRLAWAITIHKSQGLTFDRAIIDAGHSFAPGQVYVALSRCRSLDGIVIVSRINESAIINDDRVDNYIAKQEEEAERSLRQLPQLKQDYYRQLIIELFDFRSLQSAEDRFLRLMLEFFSGTDPVLAQLHRQTAADLKQKVTDVAVKWTNSIAVTTYEQLNAPAVLERIRRSAEYFSKTIEAVLSKAIELGAEVKSNNKQAVQRLKDTYSDLSHLYRFHLLLLKAIAEKGFTAATYLKEKQHSLVIAMDTAVSKGKRIRNKEKKEKKPKEEKEKTYVTSYKLYRDGMSIPDIAAARNLTVSTIFSHLGRYVETGQIKLEEIVPQNHIDIIRKAIASAGPEGGFTAIKALCPDDVTYEEIRLLNVKSKITSET